MLALHSYYCISQGNARSLCRGYGKSSSEQLKAAWRPTAGEKECLSLPLAACRLPLVACRLVLAGQFTDLRKFFATYGSPNHRTGDINLCRYASRWAIHA